MSNTTERAAGFTPGPWAAELDNEIDRIAISAEAGIIGWVDDTLSTTFLEDGNTDAYNRATLEERANGDMMAAAPELYAALAGLVEANAATWQNRSAVNETRLMEAQRTARAALARATGDGQ